MVVTSNFVSQKTLIQFWKLQLKSNQSKNSKDRKKNMKNCTMLSPKTPKNNLLTIN